MTLGGDTRSGTPTATPPYGTWVRGNRWDTAPAAPLRTVSVVVPHYEQPRQLARTLAALGRQTHPPFEVIVADDGSATQPAVPPGVRVVRQEDRGFRAGAARNLGARAASGDVLVFLDADTTPEPGLIAAIARLPSALPEAVVVGRRRHADLAAVPVDAEIESAAPAHELASPAWLADGYRASRDLLDADDRSYRYVISAVLACSRWFFEEVGGFDESFVGYGGEDWEWAHRAWLAGAVLAHAPDAVAWHDGPDWAGRHAEDAAAGADATAVEPVADAAAVDDAVANEPDADADADETQPDAAPVGADASEARADARAARTSETLRLAAAIPVAGSRPRGLRSARPDIVIDARMPATNAARFITVDAVLEALPEATVVVPDPAAFADDRVVADLVPTRVTVRLEHPVAFLDDAGARFAAIVRALGTGDRGDLILRSPDSVIVTRAESSRAAARRNRWDTASAFDTDDVTLEGVVAVGPAPNLEAWLGGWAGREQLS